MNKTTTLSFLVIGTGLLLVLPTAGLSQDARDGQETKTLVVAEQRPMYELPTLSIVAMSDIGPLSDRARSHYEQGRWSDAGDLYREAAEGMPHNDPNSYTTYDMAARLYFYGDDFGKARQMMERAAEVAEATGDVVSAAYRHVDAAFIAIWEGYPGMRREHVRAAKAYADRIDFGEEHAGRIYALINGVNALPGDDEAAESGESDESNR